MTRKIYAMFRDINIDIDAVFDAVDKTAQRMKATMDETEANDAIAIVIIKGLSLRKEHIGWQTVVRFCEFISFDKLTEKAISKISEILYDIISVKEVYSDNSSGRPYVTIFFYPLYHFLAIADETSKQKFMRFLDEIYWGAHTYYDKVVSMYNEHICQVSVKERQQLAYKSIKDEQRRTIKGLPLQIILFLIFTPMTIFLWDPNDKTFFGSLILLPGFIGFVALANIIISLIELRRAASDKISAEINVDEYELRVEKRQAEEAEMLRRIQEREDRKKARKNSNELSLLDKIALWLIFFK